MQGARAQGKGSNLLAADRGLSHTFIAHVGGREAPRSRYGHLWGRVRSHCLACGQRPSGCVLRWWRGTLSPISSYKGTNPTHKGRTLTTSPSLHLLTPPYWAPGL